MQDEWEELAEEMLEEQIFLADIDADASPRLAERFQITTNPTYILLRNRKMYTKGPSTGIEELKNWALKDWQQTLDSMVPPETEKFDVMAVISEMVEKGRINFRNLVAASKSEVSAVCCSRENRHRGRLLYIVLLCSCCPTSFLSFFFICRTRQYA